jgi:hypothetical protein
MFSFIVYEKKILTVMVNNITKINKTNNHPVIVLCVFSELRCGVIVLCVFSELRCGVIVLCVFSELKCGVIVCFVPQLTEHTQQKHNIPGWKSRSWLGTGIKIWRG